MGHLGRRGVKDLLGNLVCLDHLERKEVEACPDRKEIKEPLVQLVGLENLVKLAYLV